MGAMTYRVKEMFYSLQGEGAQAGRPAVFCRFAGCNLWSGRDEDRLRASCPFCDTGFTEREGETMAGYAHAAQLGKAIEALWPHTAGQRAKRFVVLTGGEPLLQVDHGLVEALHEADFEIAVETNGTLPAPPGLDWVCVSPKAGADLVLKTGDELKLVFPQPGLEPKQLERLGFRHFFLQPLDGPQREENTHLALRYCLEHPLWKLSLQLQKILNIP